MTAALARIQFATDPAIFPEELIPTIYAVEFREGIAKAARDMAALWSKGLVAFWHATSLVFLMGISKRTRRYDCCSARGPS